MSSFLWLLLYLAPLLGLTAALFAWLGWQWRGSDLQQRIKELQAQIDDAQAALRHAEYDAPSITSAAAVAPHDQTSDEIHALREDLKAAQAETRHRQDEAAKAHEAAQALEAEMAGLRRSLKELREEHAAAQAEALRSAQLAAEVSATAPALIETSAPAKSKRKRGASVKSPAPAFAAASLREKIAALEAQLATHQADTTTTAEMERLQNQAQALRRVEEDAAALTGVPDDDLTQIKGIKTVSSDQLRAHGIRTWRQIALWDDKEQRAFSELLSFKNRASREQWQEQARALHEAAHGTLL
jgi:predicted flap endonuclease-1-like 5' DNA nuclease